jgi:hypothetical protein
MDGLEITRFDAGQSSSRDAIREIVQVFKDGCSAVHALRRTAEHMSASEVETEIHAIEQRMLSQISSICYGCMSEAPVGPRS